MVPIAIAFGVLNLTGSARATGVVVAFHTGAQVIGLLFGGVVADRVSRRRVMIAADLVAMTSQATMAIAFVSGHATVPVLVALMICNGLALALGAACAGLSVALFGSGPTIAVDALGFGIAAVLISRIAAPVLAVARSTTMLEDLASGWAEFVSHRWLWVIVLQFSLVVAASQSVYGLIGPLVASQSMGGSTDWGFITAAFGVGTLCGGFIALRINVARPMLVATNCVFAYAAPALLLAFATTVWPIALATFLHGVCGQIFGVLWYTTLHREIPHNKLSRVSAYDNLGSIVLAPLGIFAAGFLLESLGTRTTLLIAVALVVVPTALALLDRDLRRMRLDA